MHSIKTKIPGIAFALAIAGIAVLVSDYISGLGSVLLALILGVVIGNLISQPATLVQGLKFTEKRILELAIVLIGFGFDSDRLSGLNTELVVSIVLIVALVLLLSTLLGRLFKLDGNLSLLLGVGNAICGSAAIAATAPALNAEEKEVGLSLGVINLLGIVGLAGLPALSYLFDMTDFESGFLIGATLQSVGHVAASSFAMNETVGEWAMMVKMGRVFLLIPMLVVVHFIGRKRNPDVVGRFPWFILFFAAAVYFAQTDFLSESVIASFDVLGEFMLAIAMAAIGMGIKIKPLLKLSGRGILLGTVLFAIQILVVVGILTIMSELA